MLCSACRTPLEL
ncbi:MAG: hypothetical protein HRT76_07735 [Halieaceae bacterium]|nr:hypothetical protein [Halieaceae bacterium]